MSKLKILKKQVAREAVMVAGGVVAAFAVMTVTGYLADDAMQSKNMAQGEYNQIQSQLGMMRGQISKSDEAGKRYVDIRLERDNEDFLNDTDKLKELLRDMKDQYRFADSMRLSISVDKPSDKPEFSALNYKVILRDDMEMSVAAISDLHVFSFLEEMKRRMPGVVRLKQFKLTRKAPMSFDNLTQLGTGNRVEMVDANIKFNWYTLEDKNPPQSTEATAQQPVPMGGM